MVLHRGTDGVREGELQVRNGQLIRTLCLYRTLAAERRTLQSLATDFGVTTRTVRRDLEALADAGIALW